MIIRKNVNVLTAEYKVIHKMLFRDEGVYKTPDEKELEAYSWLINKIKNTKKQKIDTITLFKENFIMRKMKYLGK